MNLKNTEKENEIISDVTWIIGLDKVDKRGAKLAMEGFPSGRDPREIKLKLIERVKEFLTELEK